jgi:hypothetical protein
MASTLLPSENLPKYRYTPLDINTREIRLLELHPGSFDDPVSISIITTPFAIPEPAPPDEDRLERIQGSLPPEWKACETLEGRILFWERATQSTTWDHPDPQYDRCTYEPESRDIGVSQLNYEALSYTWGSQNDRVAIQIVLPSPPGKTKTASSTIQGNLHDALKHLRNETDSRSLWIDAICINQEDLLERSHQVGRMRDIYTHARRVVVWLGLESSDSTLAMRTLQYIGSQIECSINSRCLRAPGCIEKDWYKVTDASHIDSDPSTWSAVYQLLLRPWFDRLWVKQEIQLANSAALVQCGTVRITWSQLRRAILFLQNLRFPDWTPPDLPRVLQNRHALAFGSKNVIPMKVLRDAVLAQCSDSRDKVYGVLGLLPPALAEAITPRYDRSNLDVYRDAFRVCIERSGSLDLLTMVGPSWKPDWSVERNFSDSGGSFSSGWSTADILSFSSDEMMVTGVAHDTIEDIAGPLSADDKTILEEVWNIWLKDVAPGQTYPTGELLASACAWTLNIGRLQDKFKGSPFVSLADAQRAFECLEQKREFVLDPNVRLHKSPIMEDGYLFRTNEGYFGFSAIEVTPGDKVCVLLGCPLPVLLRGQSFDKHLFVACAYLHGLMDGEALLEPLPEGCKVVLGNDHNGKTFQFFVDSTTQTETGEDPRLEPLPAEWERFITKDRLWPTKKVEGFWNKHTGQIMHSDPRMLPNALRARGVALETFTLL